MRNRLCILMSACLFSFLLIHSVHAEVDWEVLKTLKITGSPVDVAVAPNGSRIYVLTDTGQLRIYNIEGKIMGEMDVGPDVNRINTMQRDDIIFLSSRTYKSIQIVMVDFIRKINVSGSPYMGKAEAPIVVAIFSDFE